MKHNRLLKICAIVWGISGVVILVSAIYPIVSYEFSSRQKYPNLVSPLVKEDIEQSLGNLDYTRASNWFADGVKRRDFISSNISYYTVSIPALEIEDATVSIGGEELSESLIQYPGTSLPGKRGNAVIFGHSILPQFYDPKDYLAIFSTLPSLKKGNTIFVNYDGISYKYIIETLFEVSPTDIQILEQSSADSFLTLVTCTPPGHPLKPKRLIVRARLVPTIGPSNSLRKADANTWN